MATTTADALTRTEVAPGPKGCFVFGSLSEMRNNALGFLTDAAREYGDVVRLHLVEHVHLVNHPDLVKHVLQDRHTNYRKGFFYERMKVLVGEGLLTSDGDFWLRQRRLASPAFHRDRIARLQTAMARRTTEMLDEWERYQKSGEVFDVAAEMMRLTLGIAGETLFSVDLLGDAEAVGEAAADALEIINIRGNSLLLLPTAIPTSQNRRLTRAVRTLDGVVNDIIARRRAGEGGDDVLQMFVDAEDADTGERMSDRQLRDEVITMLLAGHETTANALAWTWYLLSKHPSVMRALRKEVDEVLAGRTPAPDDLEDMPYTRMVLQEALRRYPPAWLISREAKEDDVIGGYPIRAGSTVMMSPYVMHHHPGWWDNPEGFDPERFSPEESAGRPRFAYFPFAAGPRMCVGSAFAMMELQTIVPMMVQRYKIELAAGAAVVPEPTITLRPADGVPMTVKPA